MTTPPPTSSFTRRPTAGNTTALRDLAERRDEAGDHAAAEQLARQAADLGDTFALQELARRRDEAGDYAAVEQLLHEAAERGDIDALWDLAKRHDGAGDHTTAEQLRRFGVTDDGEPADSLE